MRAPRVERGRLTFDRVRQRLHFNRIPKIFIDWTSMLRSIVKILICFCIVFLWTESRGSAPAQSISDRIVSEHVRMILPMEREWVGRDVITDLERCWRFVNGFTGGSLPRRIFVTVNWSDYRTNTDAEGHITIGMLSPSADFDARAFLVRSAARETARMGLLGLGRGTPARGGNELLLEGMSEIIAREFFRTTKALAGAWVHARMLDQIKPLSMASLSVPAPPGEGHELRSEAPAITFLITCTSLHGRDRTLKLFEALRRGLVLEQCIPDVFRTTAPALEAEWLKKVRSYTIEEGQLATQDEDKPKLERVQCVSVADGTGARVQLRLFVRKGANILLPQGLYGYQEGSSHVFEGRAPSERGTQYMLVEIPAEAQKIPLNFSYRIVAIDEGGGVSEWQGACPPGN